MALSGDEERTLLLIEQHLRHDDPNFAQRIVALQHRIRFRQVLPPRRLWSLLGFAAIVIVLLTLASGGEESRIEPPAGPSHQISDDRRGRLQFELPPG